MDNAYALESSILAYYDILDHDLFFFPEYTDHKMIHIRDILTDKRQADFSGKRR